MTAKVFRITSITSVQGESPQPSSNINLSIASKFFTEVFKSKFFMVVTAKAVVN
jgi:hypothetical protein